MFPWTFALHFYAASSRTTNNFICRGSMRVRRLILSVGFQQLGKFESFGIFLKVITWGRGIWGKVHWERMLV